MDHKSKIYEAIQYPFEKRKDDLGSKVSCNVRTAEERLRALNLSKEELEVLKEEYERTYEGSKLGLVQEITLFGILLGSLNVVAETSEAVFPGFARFCVVLSVAIVLIIGVYGKIKKVLSANDSSRDYLMAIAILLWEKKQNEAALVHGENGTEA